MRRILFFLSNLAFLLNSACGQHKNFDDMLFDMYKKTVPLVYSDSLRAELLQDENVVLIDAREPREYQVSHLPNARFAGYDNFDMAKLTDIPRNSKIVVYCSVGYRSERIGEKLQKAGFTDVRNLYGGIFEWKNNGYPVYQDLQETDSVHAYSKKWGVWLKKGIKVYE